MGALLPIQEVISQLLGLAVAFRGTFGERFEANSLEFHGNGFIVFPGRARFRGGDLHHQFVGTTTVERPLSGEQFVEHNPQTEDIAPAVEPMPFAAGLLGTHIGRSTGDMSFGEKIVVADREAEIRYVGRAGVFFEEDVGRFQIAMDQAAIVGMLQCLSDNCQEFRRDFWGRPVLFDAVFQSLTGYEFRDDINRPGIGAAHIVDRDDMRMVQLGDRAGFLEIVFGVFGFLESIRLWLLDGNPTLKFFIFGEPDLAKGSLT